MASKPVKAGKRGSVLRVTRKGKVVYSEPASSDPLIFGDEMSLPDHPASVGISISVGTSSDYAKEKIEVAAWCTLPCDTDEASRQVAQDECALDVMEEVDRRLIEAAKRFFPELVE